MRKSGWARSRLLSESRCFLTTQGTPIRSCGWPTWLSTPQKAPDAIGSSSVRRRRVEAGYFDGSPTRARTWDLRINSPSLYQLSYRGFEAPVNASWPEDWKARILIRAGGAGQRDASGKTWFGPDYSRQMQTKLAPLRHNDPVTVIHR